ASSAVGRRSSGAGRGTGHRPARRRCACRDAAGRGRVGPRPGRAAVERCGGGRGWGGGACGGDGRRRAGGGGRGGGRGDGGLAWEGGGAGRGTPGALRGGAPEFFLPCPGGGGGGGGGGEPRSECKLLPSPPTPLPNGERGEMAMAPLVGERGEIGPFVLIGY